MCNTGKPHCFEFLEEMFFFPFLNTMSIIIIFILKHGLIRFSVAVLDLFKLTGIYVLDT